MLSMVSGIITVTLILEAFAPLIAFNCAHSDRNIVMQHTESFSERVFYYLNIYLYDSINTPTHTQVHS